MRFINFAVALALVYSTTVHAQSPAVHEPWVQMWTMGSWAFQPIVRKDCQSLTVDSFLAYQMPGAATGNNFVAVWYVSDATAPNGWKAKSWETTSLKEVIASVKQNAGVPFIYDGYWFGDDPSGFSFQPELPKDYNGGFLTADPVGTAVNSLPQRDALIDLLKDGGYKVADNPIEKGDWELRIASVLGAATIFFNNEIAHWAMTTPEEKGAHLEVFRAYATSLLATPPAWDPGVLFPPPSPPPATPPGPPILICLTTSKTIVATSGYCCADVTCRSEGDPLCVGDGNKNIYCSQSC